MIEMFQKDGASGGTDATALGLATALRDRTREAHTMDEELGQTGFGPNVVFASRSSLPLGHTTRSTLLC